MMLGTMLEQPRMIRQFGVRGGFGERPRLSFPMAAQWTAGGTCLIVDRSQPLNRLIEVDHFGRTVWRHDAPPRMNAAHRLNAAQVIVANGGTLSVGDNVLCHLPGVFALDAMDVRDGVIAAGSDSGIDIVTLECGWMHRIPCDKKIFTNPTGVQLLGGGQLLVTDSWDSRVVQLDASGQPVARFGRKRSAGSGPDCLSGPRSACRTGDGATIVADTLAHRLVEFDRQGHARVFPADVRGGLFAPSFVRETDDGRLLVVDTGNHRVLLLDRDGHQVWEYGPPVRPERMFSFPRSAEATPQGGVLVCDSFHHRVVELDAGGAEIWSYDDGLVIPRSANRCADGRTVICDGVNGRVLVLSPQGTLERVVERVSGRALADPHHAVLAGDRLLIVDSDLGEVFLVDSGDRVVNRWGRDLLDDPHHASLDASGRLLVADSGNRRVVLLAGEEIAWQLDGLRYPRFAGYGAGGRMLIADTDHARVLVLDPGGFPVREIGPVIDCREFGDVPEEIRTPRWLSRDRWGRLAITDFWNSRVVIVS